ncbi:unnamed protein product [Gongylonema pulchrum]|uniref:Neur_chan_LBD domain-containing protein n=1 Tax=Gongylonema pulchrum TaxID=637853 RepID=A0A183EW61_9BILA|nr:unnamed protein product [Gongylonema pulchrum]
MIFVIFMAIYVAVTVGNEQQLHNSSGNDDMDRSTDEQRLLHHLLRQYEKAVRPVRNASNTVIVKLGMTMTNIFDMVLFFAHSIQFYE